jgi:hypothetical protein
MFMFLATVALVSAAPATKTFDAVTFTVPAGFEFTESPDHVNFRRIDPTNWLMFGIYQARPATGDLSTEFTADWNDLLRGKGVAAPTPVARTVGSGIDAREGGALTAVGYQQLIDVDAGGSVVSIIVESGNAEGFTRYRKTIDAVLASLVVKRAPRSAPVANATPAATQTAPTEASTLIHAADLVGVWDWGSSTTTTYRLLASGEYAGAASHFSATEYTLTADGKFTSRYWATHPQVNFHSSGTWGFENGLFVVSEGNVTNRFQIVSFGTQADGKMKLSLVRPGVEINEYTQTDDWYRAAPKGAASK